ncbi:MAG: hypothetical protein NC110_00905 [Ruminococcus sp.]|nr:hypothetical protein [Ruminococcus sp.]
MELIHIGNCTVEVDKEKTEQYYKSAEKCTCEPCKNFHKLIREQYPKLSEFLDTFGIDIATPDENTWYPTDNATKCVTYHPYYSVSGRLINGGRAYLPELDINIVFGKDVSVCTQLEEPCFELYVETEIQLPWQMDKPFEMTEIAYNERLDTPLTSKKTGLLERIFNRFKKI